MLEYTDQTSLIQGGARMAVRKPKTPAWQLQTAKARFSEVFRLARSQGPQGITKQGREAVVVLPAERFDQLTARSRRPKSLVSFFRESPLAGMGIDLERAVDYGRSVEL